MNSKTGEFGTYKYRTDNNWNTYCRDLSKMAEQYFSNIFNTDNK